MTNKLFWMVQYKNDWSEAGQRPELAVSLVNLLKKNIEFSADVRLWINATESDWKFLDDYFDGDVLCNGYLQECPEGTPLSFELNEFNELRMLPQ